MSVDNPIKAAGSGTPLSLWQASSALAQVATVQADELLPRCAPGGGGAPPG